MSEIKNPPKTFTIKKPDGKTATIQKPGKTVIIRKKPKTKDTSGDTRGQQSP